MAPSLLDTRWRQVTKSLSIRTLHIKGSAPGELREVSRALMSQPWASRISRIGFDLGPHHVISFGLKDLTLAPCLIRCVKTFVAFFSIRVHKTH